MVLDMPQAGGYKTEQKHEEGAKTGQKHEGA